MPSLKLVNACAIYQRSTEDQNERFGQLFVCKYIKIRHFEVLLEDCHQVPNKYSYEGSYEQD